LSILIRPALLADLDQLVLLEKTCFDTDQLSRRSFKHWITTEHRALLVAEQTIESGRTGSLPVATLPPSRQSVMCLLFITPAPGWPESIRWPLRLRKEARASPNY